MRLWPQTRKFQRAQIKLTKAWNVSLWDGTDIYSSFASGTDHQRIAKLDRENEVAPPAKIAPSVGRVRRYVSPCTPFLSNSL